MYSNMLVSFAMASMAFTHVLAVSPDNTNGEQFITGKCNGDLACSVACCAFKTGLCANSIVGQESEDGGCGFGNAQPNSLSAQAFKQGKQEREIFNFVKQAVVSGQVGPGKLDVSGVDGGATGGGNNTATAGNAGGNAGGAAGGKQAAGQQAAGQEASGASATDSASTGFTNPSAAGNGNGEQFITGKCLSDADCDSGCCAFNTGLCAGAVFAQEAGSGDGGCGFGDKKPNDNAAQALSGKRKMRRGLRAKRSE